MGDEEEVEVEPEKVPKRNSKRAKKKVAPPLDIDSRYRAHLEKVKAGGK